MTKEIWKDIKNYEGLYQVSNLGNVKSINRIIERNDGTKQIVKERILKPTIYNGYYYVHLSKNCVGKNHRVHRLVGNAFIDNPNNYPVINHIDENKLNNNVENLEWCTVRYNTIYSLKH